MARAILVCLTGVFFLLAIGSCRTPDSNQSQLLMYGQDSRRAHMLFNSSFYHSIPSAQAESSAQQFFDANRDEIERAWESQLAHMFGTFTQHEAPTNFLGSPGIPRERPRKRITDVRKVTKQGGSFLKIDYEYYDIVVFAKDFLNRSLLDTTVTFEGSSRSARKMAFYLPKEPGVDGFEIYKRGCRSGRADRSTGQCVKSRSNDPDFNLCTDLHYNGLGDFWYFWNPKQKNTYDPAYGGYPHPNLPDCPYDVTEDLIRVEAMLVPINNTGIDNPTYPDYYRLYGENDSTTKKEIIVHFLIGIDESFNSTDLARTVFNKSSALLEEGPLAIDRLETNPACLLPGPNRPEDCLFTENEMIIFRQPSIVLFTPITDQSEVARVFGDTLPPSGQPLNRRYYRFDHPTKNFTAYLKMQLFNPDDTATLRDLGKKALSQADIFLYDGHSGLGGYFAIGNFFDDPNALPQDKYQVMFFNGCSTFSYYNFDYFQSKMSPEDPLGYENLDIITNGIGAAFTIGAGTDSILIRELLSGDQRSWVEILDKIYSVDPQTSALTQLNGDENNPKMPVNGQCPVDASFKPLYDEAGVRKPFQYDYQQHRHSQFCRPLRELKKLEPAHR